MISKLKKVELEYVRCFAGERKFESHIEFRDRNFRNTYTSNVSVLNKDIEEAELIKVINAEIKIYKKKGRDFLNFEINEEVSKEVIENLIIRPLRVDRFNYFLIESRKYEELPVKEDIILKKAEDTKDFENLIDMNIKDNAKSLGRSYAKYRINRKIQAYKDLENNLASYICYKGEIPIGSCELLVKDNICKMEDFGVLEEYRGQGVGSFIIREVLKNNYEKGISYTYVICEKKCKAERLYKKLGFKKYGEKTQLIW